MPPGPFSLNPFSTVYLKCGQTGGGVAPSLSFPLISHALFPLLFEIQPAFRYLCAMKEVAVGVITKGNQVLACQRRSDARYPLKWESPGGKIEQGETSSQALARELHEELDIRAEIGEEFFRQEWIYPDGVDNPKKVAPSGSFITLFAPLQARRSTESLSRYVGWTCMSCRHWTSSKGTRKQSRFS